MSPRRDIPRSPLAAFLRAHGAGILSAWDRAERRREPGEQVLGRGALREELPSVLARIAERLDAAIIASEALEASSEGSHRDSWTGFDSVTAELPEEPLLGLRVLERLRDGFDLEDVAAEYALLRRCVLRLLEQTGTQPSWIEMTILHEALDQVILHPAARSAAARERALSALDRVSVESVGTAQIDRLLRRLLEVLVESVRSVDWVALLLVEGESLRVRAAIGIDETLGSLRAYKLAEGFLGRVVRERRPVALRSAALDPLATDAGGGARRGKAGASSERVSDALHALYGVPLLSDGRLTGVAVVSSQRVAEFSEGDRMLFRKAGERAAALVMQMLLREQLAVERSRLEAAIQQLPVGVAVAEGTTGVIVMSNRRFAEIMRGPEESPMSAPVRSLLGETDDDQRARWVLLRALQHGETVLAEEIEFIRGEGERRLGNFSATPVRDGDGRVVAAAMVVEDMTERRKDAQARELLAQASAQLTESLGDPGAIDQVVRVGGELFADLCRLDLLDDAGAVERVVTSARRPSARSFASTLAGHPLVPGPGDDSPLSEALERGEIELVPLIADPWLQRVARAPEHLAALRELCTRSVILVPLFGRGKKKLGLLSLWGIERELRKDDVAAAAELGRLASLAIEGARLSGEVPAVVHEQEEPVSSEETQPLRPTLWAIDRAPRDLTELLGDPDGKTDKEGQED